MEPSLEKALREQLDRLAPEDQREVLAYAKSLVLRTAAGGSPMALAQFAGAIEPSDLAAMTAAIEAGCETIQHDEW